MKYARRAALISLAVAVICGAVAAWPSWIIGRTVYDHVQARDWLPVEARVQSSALKSRVTSGSVSKAWSVEGVYRYGFEGREHVSDRLGISALGGSDSFDDWHQRMGRQLAHAREAGETIRVYVNPENPAESVVDREIRWSEIFFLLPFALGFGAVAWGALWFASWLLRLEIAAKGTGEVLWRAEDRQRAARLHELVSILDGRGTRAPPILDRDIRVAQGPAAFSRPKAAAPLGKLAQTVALVALVAAVIAIEAWWPEIAAIIGIR